MSIHEPSFCSHQWSLVIKWSLSVLILARPVGMYSRTVLPSLLQLKPDQHLSTSPSLELSQLPAKTRTYRQLWLNLLISQLKKNKLLRLLGWTGRQASALQLERSQLLEREPIAGPVLARGDQQAIKQRKKPVKECHQQTINKKTYQNKCPLSVHYVSMADCTEVSNS